MKTSEIMAHSVITVTPETTIAEAARLMLQHRISGLTVVDAEGLVNDVVSVNSQTEVADVVQLMNKRRIKRLPVIDDGRLVGILSRANLVHALVKALPKKPERPVRDEEIRAAILHAIDAERWAPRFAIDVKVKGGIVDLFGTITDERERVAFQVLIENTPGVKLIRDHLVWVDSVSQIVVPH